jgi:hypothetical protein
MIYVTNRLDARHRAEQAERMAATGATWQEIADQLGYRSRQAASQAVKRLGNRTPPERCRRWRGRRSTSGIATFGPVLALATLAAVLTHPSRVLVEHPKRLVDGLGGQQECQPAETEVLGRTPVASSVTPICRLRHVRTSELHDCPPGGQTLSWFLQRSLLDRKGQLSYSGGMPSSKSA